MTDELRDLRTVPFVQIETTILRDPSIRLQLKMLYSLLVSYGPTRIFPGHKRLAKELGVSRRSVIRWLDELRDLGLITWENREGTTNLYTILGPQCEGVTPVSQEGCDTGVTGDVTRVSQGCDTGVTRSRSTNLDPHDPDPERDPNGSADADAAPSDDRVPKSFQEWVGWLEKVKNPPALIRRMIAHLYPGYELPTYGLIGKTAKTLGTGKNGYRRLMEELWRLSTAPPRGDVLPYIIKSNRKEMAEGKPVPLKRKSGGDGGLKWQDIAANNLQNAPEDDVIEVAEPPEPAHAPDPELSDEPQDVWERCLQELALSFPRQTFDLYLNGTKLERDGDRLRLHARDEYAQQWLATRMRPVVEHALSGRIRYADLEVVAPGV